jgi:parallel beta-helix repeat protein
LVDGNKILNATSAGILIDNMQQTLVSSNQIKKSKSGIRVTYSSNITIEANTIEACDAGIHLQSANNFVYSNFIGTESDDVSLKNGIGLIIESAYNKIGDINRTNFFHRNAKQGILNKGNFNPMLYNSFYFNGTSNNRKHNYKAIENYLNNGVQSNNGISNPVITHAKKDIQSNSYVISGKADPGSVIQIYRSNGFAQNANLADIEEVGNDGKITYSKGLLAEEAYADIEGNWIAFVDINNLDKENTNYIVALAYQITTDNNAYSSELSNMLPVGTCVITNNQDINDYEYPIIGSLRAAIQCANSVGEEANIVTKIFEKPIVELKALLPEINNHYGLNFSGLNKAFTEELASMLTVTIPEKSTNVDMAFHIYLKKKPSNEEEIDVNKANFKFDNIQIDNIREGFRVNVDNVTLDKVIFQPNPKQDYNKLITLQQKNRLSTNSDYYSKFNVLNSKIYNTHQIITYEGGSEVMGVYDFNITNNYFENINYLLTSNGYQSEINIESNTFQYNNDKKSKIIYSLINGLEGYDSYSFVIKKNTINIDPTFPCENNEPTFLFNMSNIISFDILLNNLNIQTNTPNKLGAVKIASTIYQVGYFNVFSNTFNTNHTAIQLSGYSYSSNGKFYINNNTIHVNNQAAFKIESFNSNNKNAPLFVEDNNITSNDNQCILVQSSASVLMRYNTLKGNIGQTKVISIADAGAHIQTPSINENVFTFKDELTQRGRRKIKGQSAANCTIDLFLSQGIEPINTVPYRDRNEYKPNESNLANALSLLSKNLNKPDNSLVTKSIKADSEGNWEFVIPIEWLRNNENPIFISAQSTDEENNSSELSNIFKLNPLTNLLKVVNTYDDGEGSLRSAILAANLSDAFSKIEFEIPPLVEDFIFDLSWRKFSTYEFFLEYSAL